MKNFFFLLVFIAVPFVSFGQIVDQDKKPSVFDNINISGSYRFFLQNRYFIDPYISGISNGDTITLAKKTVLVGDATQLPELTLNISANPSSNVSFGTDLTFWNQNTGNFDYFRGMNLGVNLYGSFKTDQGNFNVKTGGIHWLKLSRMTLKQFEGYNRYTLFVRNPWDPRNSNIMNRYSQYYDRGSIIQDVRWGNQAFQGFALDGAELPYDFNFTLLYGKAQTSGAQFADLENPDQQSIQFLNTQYYQSLLPAYVVGGRLLKALDQNYFGFNFLNGYAFRDSIAIETNNYQVQSMDFDVKTIYNLTINGELAYSKFNDLDPGIAIISKVKLPKEISFIPIDVEYFRISSTFYNNNSEVINTSVNDGISTEVGEGAVLQQNGSAILGVGQLANNRTGFSLNSETQIGKLKINFGQTISKELERLNANLTYGHSVNSLTQSEFYRWQYVNNVGPYGRWSKVFRGIYETVQLDVYRFGEIAFDKHFNSFDLQAKLEYFFNKRKSYCFYLGSFNSAQDYFSPLIVFDESAYIRQYTHQFENYTSLSNRTTFTSYLGYERVLGNYQTDLDKESLMPRNQTAFALGLGFDFSLNSNTSLFLRHRYFSYEDQNFVLDNNSGHETTLEIKVNF